MGQHDQIANELNIKTFFTRPYFLQDKENVENRNGVIRRFYSKKTDFNNMAACYTRKVETMFNNKPVKKFNYKTTTEVDLLKAKVALLFKHSN